jgi:hypothetical protein
VGPVPFDDDREEASMRQRRSDSFPVGPAGVDPRS